MSNNGAKDSAIARPEEPLTTGMSELREQRVLDDFSDCQSPAINPDGHLQNGYASRKFAQGRVA